MNKTAYDSYHKADIELNKIYKELFELLDGPEKNALIAAQKAWISFRDAHCAFEAEEVAGGSMQPMVRAACLEERTLARIEDLKGRYKEPEKLGQAVMQAGRALV
jgi:uncharacterized protein YecT (DUF1311 family)